MFDIGALELLLIVIVAIIVIGPKDMPQALRIAGRWVGKFRRTSAQFRSGFDNLVREAEMEDMEKKWKEQNARIMAATPDGEMGPLPEDEALAINAEAALTDINKPADLMADVAPDKVVSEKATPKKATPKKATPKKATETSSTDKPAGDEPMLPLGKSGER